MPRFKVYGVVTGSKYLGEFEANSKEEAEELALQSNEAYVSLCCECSDECEDPEVTEVEAVEIKD